MIKFFSLWQRRLIILILDILMVPIAWYGAYWIRYNLSSIPEEILVRATHFLLLVIVVQTIACWTFGLYRGIWRFASLPDLLRILKATIVGTLVILFFCFATVRVVDIPRAVFLLYAWLLSSLLISMRISFRLLKDKRRIFVRGQRALIVGAGETAELLLRALSTDRKTSYHPIAIVDDDPKRQGSEIRGVRVLGTLKDIPKLLVDQNIELVIIAMAAVQAKVLRKIVEQCELANLSFRIVPKLGDIVAGHINVESLRHVSVEDLLGRDPVSLDWKHIQESVGNKRVLVSGGGGSIGSELCRQIARLGVASLIVVDHSEFNLYKIDQELRRSFPSINIVTCLFDVTDTVALEAIMDSYQPQVVFHAAAYKHVPLLESQVRIAVHNNVLGTYCVANTAVEHGVETFVLISTDKAVNPENVMGATKRASEVVCQYFNAQSQTNFITVRFGNVLGSTGSVVPLFRAQLQEGGPLTVTHPEITRYFMTIPEATQLILQASVIGQGGEIFVLDMGEPIKIQYLAEQIIRLSGREPGVDVDIIYTGLRPGEKLHEELFYHNETMVPTIHDKIFRAETNVVRAKQLEKSLKGVEKLLETGKDGVILSWLKQIVPEFR